MIKAWVASAAVGVMSLFGASSTGDHRPPRLNDRTQGSSTEVRQGEGEHFGKRMGDKSASSTGQAIDVTCVGAAVATREAAIGAAMTTFTSESNTAYTTRASALATAYTQTGNDTVKTAVKSAWKQFSAAVKVAKKGWQSSRDTAWKQFKTSVKACGGGSSSVSDSGNASLESSGQ